LAWSIRYKEIVMLHEKYENSSYWVGIHQKYSGTLRAVGWPNLSEEFNKLKYYSESASFVTVMDQFILNTNNYNVLEVGVGIGYWTALQEKYCQTRGINMRVTALDISPVALTQVKDQFPGISTVLADLKTIDVDASKNQYDLVMAIMVLLHLTDVEDYLHALKFCAHSVKEGGYLILYEPFLDKHYSPFMSIECDAFVGNSIPRSFMMVDDVLRNNGLCKSFVLPGASWLLNSPIQANSKLNFKIKRAIWSILAKCIFGSARLTSVFSKLLFTLDKFFKKSNSDSGTFVLYNKQTGRSV